MKPIYLIVTIILAVIVLVAILALAGKIPEGLQGFTELLNKQI